MQENQNRRLITTAVIVAAVIAAIVIIGTMWMGRSAREATEDAVHSVSRFYLDELASRRRQVVEENLDNTIKNMRTAMSLMDDNDLSSVKNLQAYQAKIKKMYELDKFAFVDETGLIYTALGVKKNISEYEFDYKSLKGPDVSVRKAENKREVVIALPAVNMKLEGKKLRVCFVEIDMDEMLEGLSIHSDASGVTFCNLYTLTGESLTDMVLGGLANEDNLLEAMEHAECEKGYSLEKMISDFKNKEAHTGNSGLCTGQGN